MFLLFSLKIVEMHKCKKYIYFFLNEKNLKNQARLYSPTDIENYYYLC